MLDFCSGAGTSRENRTARSAQHAQVVNAKMLR